jgi:hypothetical protein
MEQVVPHISKEFAKGIRELCVFKGLCGGAESAQETDRRETLVF